MKPRRPRRNLRRPMSDEDRVRMALARFEGMNQTGTLRPIKQLEDEFDRDPAVISRAVSAAFRERLVEVRVIERQIAQPKRSKFVEQRLIGRFPSLLAAIVVDCGDQPADLDSRAGLRRNDEIHAKLGRAMADSIATGLLIRDGDIIGLGGGRGVNSAVDSPNYFQALHANSVTVVSLTGSNYARLHGGNPNVRLDADTNVGLFGPQFANEVTMRFMSHPIVAFPDDATEIVKRRIAADGATSSQAGINAALVGTGVFAIGHRFYQETLLREKERDRNLAPIFDLLKQLAEACRPRTTPIYSPVADMANRLFYVPPPAGSCDSESGKRQDREEPQPCQQATRHSERRGPETGPGNLPGGGRD